MKGVALNCLIVLNTFITLLALGNEGKENSPVQSYPLDKLLLLTIPAKALGQIILKCIFTTEPSRD